MHTKEKEKSGTCCQIKDEANLNQNRVSQLLQEMELQRRLENE